MNWLQNILASLFYNIQARRRLASIGDSRARRIRINQALVAAANQWIKLLPYGFRPKVVFDIGANRGTVTKGLHELYHLTFAALVEPIPALAAALEVGSLADRQRVFACALGQQAGSGSLNLYANDASSSLLEVTNEARSCFHLPFRKRQILSVPLKTLDIIFDESGVTHVDLLKIDVQGLEMDVFKGGQKCLAVTNLILVEVSFKPHYHGQPLFPEIYAYLLDQGFSLRRLSDFIDNEDGVAFQCDALFVRGRVK